MKHVDLARSPESLQSYQNCKVRLSEFEQEYQAKEREVKKLSNVPHYTAEIKRKLQARKTQLEDLDKTIKKINIMLSFPPGTWVRNGTPKPGMVIDLVIAGRVPEVHIQWWGSTVPIPEQPEKLSFVPNDELEYIWNGDRCPKLIRKCDRIECEEIEILNEELIKWQEVKRLAVKENQSDEEIQEYQLKITYLTKKIDWVNNQDLYRLERTIRQGLDIFYRVGEALLEIRDRKLYKELGYSNFRDYCFEKWNMKKSRAYQLIESANVVNNLKSVHNGGQNLPQLESVPNCGQNKNSEKSVHNCGQNSAIAYQSSEKQSGLLMPASEFVTRELGKAPAEKQKEAWQMTVEQYGENPTAKQVKSVVAEIINDNDNTQPLLTDKAKNVNKLIIQDFQVGQVVQIKSDRSDKRLVGYNRSVGLITQVNPASVSIKIWGQKFDNVSPNDLAILDEDKLPAICVSPSADEYRMLLLGFNSKEEIIKAAIAARSLENESRKAY